MELQELWGRPTLSYSRCIDELGKNLSGEKRQENKKLEKSLKARRDRFLLRDCRRDRAFDETEEVRAVFKKAQLKNLVKPMRPRSERRLVAR